MNNDPKNGFRASRLDSQSKRKLADIFQQFPEIQAVYQFGSSVTGKTHNESDLDLGIFTQASLSPTQKLDLQAAVVREGFDQVDLVYLEYDDIVLMHEVVKHNRIVYHVADFNSGILYSQVIRQYLDFLPYLKVQREAYKERILSGK